MKKVLIAEDEEILRKVLNDRFKKDGWDVDAVKNGQEALKELRRKNFDLVLLDIIMPEKTGFDVLEEMKKDEKLKGISVIVLSSLDNQEDIKRAMDLGADDSFIKTQHPVSEVVEKAHKYASGDKTTRAN